MVSSIIQVQVKKSFVDLTAVKTKFQMKCIELQSNIQLKEKCDYSFLFNFYKYYNYSLALKKTYPVLHDPILFIFSVFG